MPRVALVTFVTLVAASLAAFVVAQRLKGAPAVVKLRHARAPFSPNGDHRRDVKRFAVVVQESERLTVALVDEDGGEVRRLADGTLARAGVPLRLRWDGRDDDGRIVPDGVYHVRVTLGRTGRTVTPAHGVRVDTRPPRPYVKTVGPSRVVAPGTPVTFTVGNPGRTRATRVAIVRTDVRSPEVVARGEVPGGRRSWTWDGTVDGAPAPAGVYLAQLERADAAGNLARVPAQVPTRAPIPGAPGVTVRGLAAVPPVGPVTAGERVAVKVDSRRRGYRWSLQRVGERRPAAAGRGRGATLRFTAPAGRSGLYVLALRSGTAGTRVPILVQSTERAKLLVVVPAITWLGRAAVDDGTDGQPDTLDAGGPVRWPRVLPELPVGFRSVVAPLLVFLDRAHVRYDLTSDLALALGGGPRATDRPAVLLAGAERWIPAPYGHSLRRYVTDGGRLATIATESLRRGVVLLHRPDGSQGQLVRPTAAVNRDPFGARLRLSRGVDPATELQPITGSATAPLLAYWDGTLTGFDAAEESLPPDAEDPVKVVAGVGAPPGTSATGAPEPPRPALTQVTLGKGTVIRIGLPGWASRLTTDADVAQLTGNAIDVLLGATPRARDLAELAPPKPPRQRRRHRARRG